MTVSLNQVINSKEFKETKNLPLALGRTESGENVVIDLSKQPHLLVAGATGSGKSVCLDSIILSLVERDVKLVLVDTKIVGFSIYNGLPQLLVPVCTTEAQVEKALMCLEVSMNQRYDKLANARVRSIEAYNETHEDKLDRVVLIIDEYADLVIGNKNIQTLLTKSVQKCRACGIYIILSTQRPSAEVVTGLIKSNIPARIALKTSSSIDSRVILDTSGAESLRGNGDMIYKLGDKQIRLQGAYISDNEIAEIVEHKSVNKEDFVPSAPAAKTPSITVDDLTIEAGNYILERGKVNIGTLQRHFNIGFNRACSIISQLEDIGLISKTEGSTPSRVIMTEEQFRRVI